MQEFYYVSLVISPSFVRQEFGDESNNDGWNYLEGRFMMGHRYADLSPISNSSNGSATQSVSNEENSWQIHFTFIKDWREEFNKGRFIITKQ